MTQGPDGGAAFPGTTSEPNERGVFYPVHHQGMSLRDWFAGQALAGLPHLCAHDTLLDGLTFEQHVARNAYLLADAMLAARSNGEG